MTETTPDKQTENTEPERDNPGSGNDQTAAAAEGDTAPTQQSTDASEATGAVTDEQLPEDLQPTDDNPLAKPLDDDDTDSGMKVGPDGPTS
jgi:hypothetical protein